MLYVEGPRIEYNCHVIPVRCFLLQVSSWQVRTKQKDIVIHTEGNHTIRFTSSATTGGKDELPLQSEASITAKGRVN